MGMLLQEVRGLRRNVAEVFKRYATEKAMAADTRWRRPMFEKEKQEIKLTAEVEGSDQYGKVDLRKHCQVA